MTQHIDINRYKKIIDQLKEYNLLSKFSSEEELNEWISKLNELQVNNIISLNVENDQIKFDEKLLINFNLLNTTDYLNRVNEFISIKNADGWYHLFDYMVEPEFLNSPKFYSDIEKLKRAKCAQTPLWIIGEPSFINSPYHDEDFELLVTAEDTCSKKFDFVVWDAIATISKNDDSIRSKFHRQDLQTIIKYGSDSLQISHSYPEGSINNLALNKVSLKNHNHLIDMEILAQNRDIGNFLYAIMTDEESIKKDNYYRVINEMVNNKENEAYVFLICYYMIGEEKTKKAQNYLVHNYLYEIKNKYDIDDLMNKIDEKLNIIEGITKETINSYIEYGDIKEEPKTKSKNLIKRIFNKINK